jgi:hypothetical protein
MRLTILLLCLAATASAGIIFSNLGPAGNPYGGAYTAAGTPPFSEGTVFRAAASGSLTDVLVPIANEPSGVLTFDLYADASGQPGTLLEDWANVSVPTSITGLLTINSVAHPFLTAGNLYWFTTTTNATTSGFGLQWAANNQGVSGGLWGSSPGFPWARSFSVDFPMPALQLDSVPEPSTWLLFTCALSAVLWRRRATAR